MSGSNLSKNFDGSSSRELGRIIEEKGLAWFREQEFKTLELLLQNCGHQLKAPVLIALGGGAFDSKAHSLCQKHAEVLTVFLNTPFELCYQRIEDDKNRPLAKLGKDKLFATYNERLALYQKADITLNDFPLNFIEALLSLGHNFKEM